MSTTKKNPALLLSSKQVKITRGREEGESDPDRRKYVLHVGTKLHDEMVKETNWTDKEVPGRQVLSYRGEKDYKKYPLRGEGVEIRRGEAGEYKIYVDEWLQSAMVDKDSWETVEKEVVYPYILGYAAVDDGLEGARMDIPCY